MEAIYTLFWRGSRGVHEIDTVMETRDGHIHGTTLQLADFIGLDVCLSILKVLHEVSGNPKMLHAHF